VFKAWLDFGMNNEVYLRYQRKLMAITIQSIKKFKVKMKIKKLKEKKWKDVLQRNLKKRYFFAIKTITQSLSVKNRHKKQ
jgi:hypothetical protein